MFIRDALKKSRGYDYVNVDTMGFDFSNSYSCDFPNDLFV